MRHSRPDYNRIQDPANLIPEDEPVFLLRGQDKYAPDTLRAYASSIYDRGKGDAEAMREIYAHADRMEAWQRDHGSKTPDAPKSPMPARPLPPVAEALESQRDNPTGEDRALYSDGVVTCTVCGGTRELFKSCANCASLRAGVGR